MNKEQLKPIQCLCGSKNICVCKVPTTEYWIVHCQDCDWHYGGSSLCTDKEETIKAWNTRKENKEKCPHWFRSTDGVHIVVVDRCNHPDCEKWKDNK